MACRLRSRCRVEASATSARTNMRANRRAVTRRSAVGVVLALALGCSGGGGGSAGASGGGGDGSIGMGAKPGVPLTPGTKVALELSSADQGELSAIESKLDALEGLTASELI